MTVPSPRIIAALLPIMAAVLIAFLVTGLTMPVLPLHVHEGLGPSPSAQTEKAHKDASLSRLRVGPFGQCRREIGRLSADRREPRVLGPP